MTVNQGQAFIRNVNGLGPEAVKLRESPRHTDVGLGKQLGPTCVGPYPSIGDGRRLVNADIEASIVIGDCVIETPNRIVNSLIGRYTAIRSGNN